MQNPSFPPNSEGNLDEIVNYRDSDPYCARNLMGALLKESEKVFQCLEQGLPISEIRDRALNGKIFTQKAHLSRKRNWNTVYIRYLKLPEWVLQDIIEAYKSGPHSSEFISLLYLHYVLSDHLTFDFITQILWDKWNTQNYSVSRDDILKMLDDASDSESKINTWTDATRMRLSSIILSSLKDFGILSGKQKKKLLKPVLPLPTAEHILRILTAEGLQGNLVIKDPIWRLFFCTENDVANYLQQLSFNRRIRFEKVGDTVMITTPEEWENRK